jgi:hypothetical protein
MRTLALLMLPALVLLSGCATPAASTCDFATVPAGAVFGVRHNTDTATYPPEASRVGASCQRVWHGDRQRPEAMQVLATYHFEQGHVRRLVGRMPGGPAYDCLYLQDGALDTSRSQNPAQCPKATELERAR